MSIAVDCLPPRRLLRCGRPRVRPLGGDGSGDVLGGDGGTGGSAGASGAGVGVSTTGVGSPEVSTDSPDPRTEVRRRRRPWSASGSGACPANRRERRRVMASTPWSTLENRKTVIKMTIHVRKRL